MNLKKKVIIIPLSRCENFRTKMPNFHCNKNVKKNLLFTLSYCGEMTVKTAAPHKHCNVNC